MVRGSVCVGAGIVQVYVLGQVYVSVQVHVSAGVCISAGVVVSKGVWLDVCFGASHQKVQ